MAQPMRSTGPYTLIYYTGDCNNDGSVTFLDLQYLGLYLWYGGPPPVHYWSADVDCSGRVDVEDVACLHDYFYDNGMAPCGNAYAGQYDE